MKHFAIEGGKVRSYNGLVALCSPIPFDIDCYPKADMLFKAIQNCEETVQLSLTPAGKLRITSGNFKALVPCIEKSEMHSFPTGSMYKIEGQALIDAFKVLEPFIGDDASRPWANGILMKGSSAFATCNVVLVEYWTGLNIPHVVNIPGPAIREVLRLKEAPVALQIDDNSITFHFESERWVRTQLFATDWPDLEKILSMPSNPSPIDERIFVSMEKIKAFLEKDRKVVFQKDSVSTTADSESDGGFVALSGSDMTGVYSWDMLMLLKGVATSADFSTYPSPCMFFGDRLRGAIVGRRA